MTGSGETVGTGLPAVVGGVGEDCGLDENLELRFEIHDNFRPIDGDCDRASRVDFGDGVVMVSALFRVWRCGR